MAEHLMLTSQEIAAIINESRQGNEIENSVDDVDVEGQQSDYENKFESHYEVLDKDKYKEAIKGLK